MILRGGLSNWRLFAVAAITGCTQAPTNDAGNSPTHEETKQIDAEMQVLRGLQYTIGPSKDYRQAFVLFRKAAEQGSANGENSLAQCYEAGHGVERNETEAVVWYRKAAEHGLPVARAHLRTMFVRGQLKPVDDDQGGKWWQGLVQQAASESQSFSRAYAAAAQGNADAEVELGIDYLTGVGVSKDRTQATFLFQQAAEQGQTEAQCLASAIAASDDDWAIPAETKHAADLCLNAANQGYADAQLVLGTFYTMGRGVPRDATQAVFWHRKAAEQGRPDAEYMLGYDYERGNGVPKDDAQSVIWLRKAADQGQSAAMFSLGIQASVAKTTGKEDPLHDRALAQKFTDLGVEYTSTDLERGLLRNMWASRAEQERQRQQQKQLSRALAPALKAMGVDGQ
ncbi:tetratricopeptide repeat protein [Paraburkholderia tropica]|uniref:tetratricopeptide repeat protein n=1 Tax=Paraburkholderia tropica TaxID=92647 RepID=UPI002AB12316|nr:tetratricopeptide repeat protein [Paraburkholderia tropica]